jgi:hypothetical protein
MTAKRPNLPHARLLFLGLAILSATTAPGFLLGSTVRHCGLMTLSRCSGAVFYGRCISKESFPEAEPYPYVEYTFKVLEAVKGCRDRQGKALETVTFRHVSDLPARQLADGTQVTALRLGVPRYKEGEEAVLFLTRESHVRLCAPVGLHQGVFRVQRNGDSRTLTNGMRNHALLDSIRESDCEAFTTRELQELRRQGDSLKLESFLKLCRSLKG